MVKLVARTTKKRGARRTSFLLAPRSYRVTYSLVRLLGLAISISTLAIMNGP